MTIENFQNHFIFEFFLFLISSFGKVSPVNVVLAIALHMCCQSRRNLFGMLIIMVASQNCQKKKKKGLVFNVHPSKKKSLKIIA